MHPPLDHWRLAAGALTLEYLRLMMGESQIMATPMDIELIT
tara:strand:- start:79 stop:201 length:123 start_codon:yes stop_codon:yes gene_type:complete